MRCLALILLAPLVALAETPMPRPPRQPLTETLHGVSVQDPYRPLESMEQAAPWIDAQNARLDGWLAGHPRPGLAERVEALFRIGHVGSPAVVPGAVFFMQKLPGAEQPALFGQPDGEPARVLVDPGALDAAGHVALDWFYPSQDGAKVAYGTSKDGDEVSTLRVIEVATGRVLDDAIPYTRACSLAWLPDGGGFVYTRHEGVTAYDRHVYEHRLGAPWADDALIMGKDRLPERSDWPAVGLSSDGRWLSVVRYVSWSNSTLHLYDRDAKRWTDVDAGPADGVWSVPQMTADGFYATTTHATPNGRLVRVDPEHPEPGKWVEILPEGRWPLEGVGLVKGGMVAQRLVNAVSELTLHARDGRALGALPTPVKGTVDGLATDPDVDRVLWSFNSFFYPPTLFSTPVTAEGPGATQTLLQVATDLDLDAYTVDQVEYPSFDGTSVPMFLVHRKDLVRDGANRTLLYGYGGFNVSITPGFSRNVLYWLE